MICFGGEQAERAVARGSLAFFFGSDDPMGTEVLVMMVKRTLTPLKVCRLEVGVPQIALATEAGIPVSRLSQIECGWVEARADELERLAAALNIDVEQLRVRRAA